MRLQNSLLPTVFLAIPIVIVVRLPAGVPLPPAESRDDAGRWPIPSIPGPQLSRQSIELWLQSLKKNTDLQQSYENEFLLSENIPAMKKDGCPLELIDADIQLVYARGRRISGKDEKILQMSSIAEVNSFSMAFHINDGNCGYITVKTTPKVEAGASKPDESQWVQVWRYPKYYPEWTSLNQPVRSLLVTDLQTSPEKALEAGASQAKYLITGRGGFRSLELLHALWGDKSELEPVYRFSGFVNNADAIVEVRTKDGVARKAQGQV